jgi:hypothetical protein
MKWKVTDHSKYTEWFESRGEDLQDKILEMVELLQQEGPMLGRPHADTLEGSTYPNMKELRVQHRGNPWRIIFAFDPERMGILLLGGNKAGNSNWYDKNIPIADKRYAEHLEQTKRVNQNDNSRRTNGKVTKGQKRKN